MPKTAVMIPRGTCRLFGAIKAVSNIRNTAILVHGPKGCVYHINYILGMRGDRPSQIYSTCLDEHDIIFGAETKLKTAIEELDTDLSPELLAVMSCCASSIIGEDVESAVKDAITKCRVISIESGGFEGDFRTGYGDTLKRLVEELVTCDNPVSQHSVNLIGLLRAGPDLLELKRLLGIIGVNVNAVLTADSTLHQIERIGSAAQNIVLCEPAGLAAAELLQRKCHIPYFTAEFPIGHAATRRFLEEVASALDIPFDSGIIECPKIPITSVAARKRRIAIVSGPTRAISMTRFLVDLDIEPTVIVVDFDSETRETLSSLVSSSVILVEPEQEEMIQTFKEQQIDLIIGGMLERPIAAALGIDHLDMMHGSQKTVGCMGGENLIPFLKK